MSDNPPFDRPGAGHRTGGEAVNPDGAGRSDAPNAASFINCVRDDFVQVRRLDGTLVGCMPQFGEGIERVYTNTGRTCDVATGIVRGVLIPDDVDPRDITGFTPREGVKLDPVVREDGTVNAEVLPS